MTQALGRMVGLLLTLYVFDQIIDVLNGSGGGTNISDSTWFSDAVSFIQSLFPVIGILGSFEIIYNALKSSKMI